MALGRSRDSWSWQQRAVHSLTSHDTGCRNTEVQILLRYVYGLVG